MGRWTEQAAWVGPTPNVSGSMREQRGMVLHVMQGSLAGSVAWGKNPASRVSFHFGTSKSGLCQQLVDTDVTAWTQGAGNGSWVSVENEDFTGNPLSAEQVECVAQMYARGVREYSWPYQMANSPSGRGLGYHAMGGAAWGNHPDCPGQPIIDQRGLILARAEQINGGGPTPQTRRDQDMFRLIDPDNAQFAIYPEALSVTGWAYTQIIIGDQDRMLVAGGVGTANGSANDPNHDPFANEKWRPGTFGPSAAEVRDLLIGDIVLRVIEHLPPSQGGAAPTLAQITAAVRAELDRTGLASVPGMLEPTDA